MKFTHEQKLIVTLLTDIYRKLNITDGVDPDFVQDAVSSGRGWALGWQYPGIFEGAVDTPPEVDFVVKVLELWSRLEASLDELSDEGRAYVDAGASPYEADSKFPGFDGNGGDDDAFGIAHLLINRMGRWTTFQGRDLNSHMPMSDVYQRMLEELAIIGKGQMDYYFSPEEIVRLLIAQRHPDNR